MQLCPPLPRGLGSWEREGDHYATSIFSPPLALFPPYPSFPPSPLHSALAFSFCLRMQRSLGSRGAARGLRSQPENAPRGRGRESGGPWARFGNLGLSGPGPGRGCLPARRGRGSRGPGERQPCGGPRGARGRARSRPRLRGCGGPQRAGKEQGSRAGEGSAGSASTAAATFSAF